MVGFISSPFYENDMRWAIRENIRKCLGRIGHRSWAWEFEGVQEHVRQPRKKSENIISEAIAKSDFAVVVYKSNAGSPFEDSTIPVFATEFEIIEALKYKIPILFYVINSPSKQNDLFKTISLFGSKIILSNRPKYCKDEESMINELIFDVQALDNKKIIVHPPFQGNEMSDDLDIINAILSANLFSGNFELSLGIIDNNPQMLNFYPRNRDEKVLLARYLGNCGKVFAHSRKYKKAIQATRRSIRLLMECSYYNDLFFQIEALSGILNMAGIKIAKPLNGYAQRGIKLSPELAIRIRDSEASILRDRGEYQKAINRIQEDRERTPYSGAKFAYLLSLTGKLGCIEQARAILENNIIQSQMEEVDQEYVLRNAGFVALKDGHKDTALSYLNEAARICQQKGALHTMMGINKIISTIS